MGAVCTAVVDTLLLEALSQLAIDRIADFLPRAFVDRTFSLDLPMLAHGSAEEFYGFGVIEPGDNHDMLNFDLSSHGKG